MAFWSYQHYSDATWWF